MEHVNLSTFSSDAVTERASQRETSESCRLENIYVEACHDSVVHSGFNNDPRLNGEKQTAPASLESLRELEELTDEEELLKNLIQTNKANFSQEHSQLESLISDHHHHVISSLCRKVRLAGRNLTDEVQTHQSADKDRQLARHDRSFNFKVACDAADRATTLSLDLNEKRRTLQYLWEDSFQSKSSLSLFNELRREGERLSESAMKSCARKHALRIAKAAAVLSNAIEQKELSKIQSTNNANSIPVKVIVCLRPIIPTTSLLPVAHHFDASHQRGYSIHFDCKKRTITFNTPKGEQIQHLPNTSLYELGHTTTANNLLAEEVLPALSKVCETGKSACIFSCGGSNSGKLELLFGLTESPKVTASAATSSETTGITPVPTERFLHQSNCCDLSVCSKDVSPWVEQGLVRSCVQWLLQATPFCVSSLSFAMFELHGDRIYDALDFVSPPSEDPYDIKNKGKNGSKKKEPVELNLRHTSPANPTSPQGWETDGKRLPITSGEQAYMEIQKALSNVRSHREGDLDWSCIVIDIRFTVQHSIDLQQPFHPIAEKSSLCFPQNPSKIEKVGSDVSVVFCKLPNSQRQGLNEDLLAVQSAKKCLGSLRDVLVALQRNTNVSNHSESTIPNINETNKAWSSGISSNGKLTLSREIPKLLNDFPKENWRLFSVPATRNGLLASRRHTVPSSVFAASDHKSFVPFRNHKLTQLLFSALQGSSNHLLITTISPCTILETSMPSVTHSSKNHELLTREAFLRFGQQAQQVIDTAKFSLQFAQALL